MEEGGEWWEMHVGPSLGKGGRSVDKGRLGRCRLRFGKKGTAVSVVGIYSRVSSWILCFHMGTDM